MGLGKAGWFEQNGTEFVWSLNCDQDAWMDTEMEGYMDGYMNGYIEGRTY